MVCYSDIVDVVRSDIRDYIERTILPRYDHFDAAHRRDHVDMVIVQSLSIARNYDVDPDMVYVIAAYHDTGLVNGRERHHIDSKHIVLDDMHLREWFSADQILVMAEAVEDHRASSSNPPRSIYGRIVSEADRVIEPETIIRRTIQYTLANYPNLDYEEGYGRMVEHLRAKYGYGGYLKLWIEESENGRRLEELRKLIGQEDALSEIYARIYAEESRLAK